MAMESEILRELENISTLLGDLNYIRNGDYDPPRGANPDSKHVHATPDDIFNMLQTVVALLQRQNEMIYNLGQDRGA